MKRSLLGFALLSSLTFSACQETNAPLPSESGQDAPRHDDAGAIEAVTPFEAFSAAIPHATTMEPFSVLWPPVTTWAGVNASAHEAFLGVVPVEGSSGTKGFFALTIPQEAISESLESSFLALNRKRFSVLFYPAKDASRAGEDSEIDLLDEVDNLETKLGNVVLPASLAPFFRLQRQGNSLFELCFPVAVEAQYQGYRVLSSRLGQRCRTWSILNGRAFEIDANDQRVSTWTETTADSPSNNDSEFLASEDGRLWRRIEVPIPALNGDSSTEIVFLEWPKAQGEIEDLRWDLQLATQELRSWAHSERHDSLDLARQALARLLALRTYASGISSQTEAWFELEAKVLEKAATSIAKSTDLETAWTFMSDVVSQLHSAAGGTLPRPNATMLFVDEKQEIVELGWRGTGHTLDLGRFPTWIQTQDGWALDLPTRRNGVLRCNENRCSRTEREREAKSLYHPTQAIVVTHIENTGTNPSLVLTSTYGPHHCETLHHCGATANCTSVRLSALNTPNRRAGKVFAAVPIKGIAGVKQTSESCDVPRASSQDLYRPLGWSNANEFLFLSEASIRALNVETGTSRDISLEELTPQQQSVAGYSSSTTRYELRYRGADAAVWKVAGAEESMMPLVGIRAPQAPASFHSWLLPTPDDSLVAVIWHGVFVGVWPTLRRGEE